MIQSQSSGHAKSYFSEALLKSDYFLGDQELNGTFRGGLSERLGITGIATRDQFFALCENRHPETGKPLTPRTKKDRTVGYDINFHVPKSVSILHALARDNHVLEAFHSSVIDTMRDIEKDTRTRVRKNGRYEDRVTGEFLYVDFIHQTARPVDGFAPDPHLHAHCYVFNVTWDKEEGRLKAAQFRHINSDMPFYQAAFHKRLSDKLVALGYQVRLTEKSFEVEGVPQEVINLFSKRTDAIGRVAKEKGITDAGQLAELGARTRAKKDKGLSMDELREDWRQQIHSLSGQDTSGEQAVRNGPLLEKHRETRNLSLESCIDYTLSHSFTRASVVPFNRLAATALRFSIGSSLVPDAIVEGLRNDRRIIQVKERNTLLCTTKEVLREEQKMVQLAVDGKGKFAPLCLDVPEIRAQGQQGNAIRHILTTSDMVSIVRGAAGAGKTTLMKEAIEHIETAGKTVSIVAPLSRVSRGVLKKEGYDDAQTVATFLMDTKRQEDIKGQVLWVDEAGMLGTQDMSALLQIATKQKVRIILGGDTRQHASVARGDALRILNTIGGIQAAEVDKIYRQKEEVYREAVKDLSQGKIADGFDKLDSIAAIKETDLFGENSPLVNDYVASIKNNKAALVICPTHDHGEKVTNALRGRLKQEGLIGKKEITALRYKNLNLTPAQKTDWRNFQLGSVVQFNQNRKGVQRGSVWKVASASEAEVTIADAKGRHLPLALEKTEQFDLYKEQEITLAKGDKVQITKNSFDREKKRLNNGDVFDVASVSQKGTIILVNNSGKATYEIDKTFGNIAHAHCVTSHASQGATVDEIFIAQHSATFPASDAKQFYVSVSRAREKVSIYTDDKQELLYQVSETGDRQSAMELVREKSPGIDAIRHAQMEMQKVQEIEHGKTTQDPSPQQTITYEDYEPGL
jgi:conjugative relaxase-like TrwC/TraI family protein